MGGFIPRHFRKPTLFRACFCIFAVWTLLDLFRCFALRVQSPQKTKSQPSGAETLYIASTHWNNEYVLRIYWNDQIVRIAEYFGPYNVFMSVYESGSWDNSKGALRELDLKLNNLGVPHKIVLDPTTHQDEISKSPAEFGWVRTPRGKKELRRIPYISGLRNLSLEPLLNLYQNGTRFDKVLFLNDVIFSVADVTTLLSTNDGDYAAACSLDFSKQRQPSTTRSLSGTRKAIRQSYQPGRIFAQEALGVL